MDIKKLEKLENIRNFLENDNIAALSRYVEKIKPLVSKDEDFSDIFQELNGKNYDQALLITEDIIYDMKGQSKEDNDDYDSMAEFEEEDDFIYEGTDDDFGDVGMDSYENDGYYDDREEDYF
jgi:hypothetical protein